MIISVKICDMCDTCVYGGEYEIIDGDVVCVICQDEIEEEKEEYEETLKEFEHRIHV